MHLRPGLRLISTVCETAIVVVRATQPELDVRCGGAPMIALGEEIARGDGPQAGFAAGTQVGKRYWDQDSGLEVMCTTGGAGSLSIGDRPVDVKPAKPLPSSD